MREWQSQSHVRWYCKYHIVFVPKYKQHVIYGQLRRRIGAMLRELCQQQGIVSGGGHAMPDHVPLCLSIPPKYRYGQYRRFSEGQVSHPDPSGVFGPRAEFYRVAFLGAWVLCQYDRAG